MHLIGRKVKSPSRHFQRKFKNNKFNMSIGSSLPQFYIQFGSSSTWTWHVPRNRSGPRKYLCGVVGCFRDEKPPLREVEPPEPPEQSRDLRRPLPQPRPPAAPQKHNDHRKPSFASLSASQTTRASSRLPLRSELRSLYRRRCCQRGASELHQPTPEIPRAIAS